MPHIMFETGDQVTVSRNGRTVRIRTVERTTATIAYVDGVAYRRQDGRQRGGGSAWSTQSIRYTSAADLADLAEHAADDRLRSLQDAAGQHTPDTRHALHAAFQTWANADQQAERRRAAADATAEQA